MRSVYEQRRENLRSLSKQWDDPIEDIRRKVRWTLILSAIGAVLTLIHALS